MRDLVDFIASRFTGLSGNFRYYEEMILDECTLWLTEGRRQELVAQIENVTSLQRSNEGRMVLLFGRGGRRLAGCDGDDECLYSGRLTNTDGKQVVGRVFAYGGGVHRLEFKPSPRVLGDGPITIRMIRSRKPVVSIAEEIDREEHDDSYER
jgi:hypothetical protein